VQRAPRTG